MAQARTPLPVVEIKRPCPADWEAMEGDSRERFCGGCQKHVHDLSAMTPDEAQALLCSSAGPLCVRFAVAAASEMPSPLEYAARPQRARWKFLAALTSVGCAAAAALGLFVRKPAPSPPARVYVLGEMSAPIPLTAPNTAATQPCARHQD